jgi:TrmH family RNA methyltransferase
VKGSASPFNPKTLRASAGSIFRLPFLHSIEAADVIEALSAHGIDGYAAVPPRPGTPARKAFEADLRGPCALVIGSEAHGVGTRFREVCDSVSIPTAGVESLNAAIAAAILLYEAQRQRTGAR